MFLLSVIESLANYSEPLNLNSQKYRSSKRDTFSLFISAYQIIFIFKIHPERNRNYETTLYLFNKLTIVTTCFFINCVIETDVETTP